MLRALVLCLCLLPFGAVAQGLLKNFSSQTVTPMDEITRQLQARMPGDVVVFDQGEMVMLSYSGRNTPAGLKRFLEAGFPDLDVGVLGVGQPISLSLMISEGGQATEMTLIVHGAFASHRARLPAGARVMLDDAGEGCSGQIVASHDVAQAEAAELYQAHLGAAGFVFDPDPEEDALFIGERDGCSVTLYLRRDVSAPRATVVVLRYLAG